MVSRVFCIQALGAGYLALAGCSSTLDEYRCTTDEQCTSSDSTGLCHSSGYCTFLDEDQCGGFRFGEHSGDLSNQCVDDAALPDGGTPTGTRPVASIANFNLPCDKTIVNLDGTDSEAFDGAVLDLFEWTLLSPSGNTIDGISGPPGNAFGRGPHFVNGTLARPIANLTFYMDEMALHVVTGNSSTEVFQDSMSIKEGNRVLYFTMGGNGGANGAGADLAISLKGMSGASLLTAVETTRPVTDKLVSHELNFEVDSDVSSVVLSFLASEGSYWIDNIGIDNKGAGGASAPPIVTNRSFETDMIPWQSNKLVPESSVAVEALPLELKAYGQYEIELVVTDSNGLKSLPDTIEVDHLSCSPTP